jgi:hypothetical protein
LQLNVVALFDAVNAGMDLGAARRDAGHFLTQEKIGIAPKFLGRVNRIMIRDRDQVHAAPFQGLINGFRIAITFAANSVHYGDVAHARVPRVNVQIAPHASFVARVGLQIGDLWKKHS